MSARIAAAQYPVGQPGSWAEAERKLQDWVGVAAAAGAQLLVFPEYAAMELAALFAPAVQTDLAVQLTALQTLRDDYLALHARLAQQQRIYLLAGSFPWEVEAGRFHNRAWLCAPDGGVEFQDKCLMTRFERESWRISGGAALKVFHTAIGAIAVNICYDSEFPLLARAQADAGAELILVPSCTDTLAGYHRVRIGCQARALENQCVVVQSPLVGSAPWSPAVDVNIGAAGVFGPPDYGFPADGVLAVGELDRPGWIYAEFDAEQVHRVRNEGQVLNHRHWSEQSPAAATIVESVAL